MQKESSVRDIYEVEKILIPIFEKLSNDEIDYDEPDLTDDEGYRMLEHLCYLMRKDVAEHEFLKSWQIMRQTTKGHKDVSKHEQGHLMEDDLK